MAMTYPSGYPNSPVPVTFEGGDAGPDRYPSGYPRDPVPVRPVNEDGDPIDVATSDDLAAKADLLGGVIPSSQLPQVAITAAQVVPNRAAMLALEVQQGDVAVVVEDDDDLTRTYILAGEDADPTEFESWIALPSPGDVNSVNGHVGVVVLNAAAVGAIARLGASASGTRVPITDSAGAEGVAVVAVSSPLTSTIVRRTGTGQIVAADAVNSNEAVTKAQLDKPSSIGLTGASEIAVRGASDVWGRVLMTAAPTASTVAYRGAAGTLKATNGTASDDLVNKGQLDAKVDRTATASRLYGVDSGGNQVALPYSGGTTGDTIAMRTSTGALQVGAPTIAAHAVRLSDLDGRLSAAQRAAINALPTSGATVDQVVAALKAT